MGERLEQTLGKMGSDRKYKDPEYLGYLKLAHETQQDKAGLTPDQTEWLNKYDNKLKAKSIITEFDREQSEVFLLTGPVETEE